MTEKEESEKELPGLIFRSKNRDKSKPKLSEMVKAYEQDKGDKWAWVPLGLIAFATLLSLWFCWPSAEQWKAPIDHNSVFNSWSFNLPPHFADKQGNRDKEIHELSVLLSTNDARVLLHGPSGVGKKEIALNYLSKAEKNYSVILWFNSYSEPALRAEYAILSNYLRLRTMDQKSTSVVEAVLAWLYKQKTNSLLIFYGCSEIKWLDSYIPRVGARVLYISNAPLSVEKRVDVKPLPALRTLELLSTLSKKEPAHFTGVEPSPTVSLVLTARLFETESQHPISNFFVSPTHKVIQLKTVMKELLNVVKSERPSAYTMIVHLALLTPAGISRGFINTFAENFHSSYSVPPNGAAPTSGTWSGDLDVLEDFYLVSKQRQRLSSKSTTSYFIHPLVQEAIQANLSPSDLNKFRLQVLGTLDEEATDFPILTDGIPPSLTGRGPKKQSLLPASAYIPIIEPCAHHEYGDAGLIHSMLLLSSGINGTNSIELPHPEAVIDALWGMGFYHLWIQARPKLALEFFQHAHAFSLRQVELARTAAAAAAAKKKSANDDPSDDESPAAKDNPAKDNPIFASESRLARSFNTLGFAMADIAEHNMKVSKNGGVEQWGKAIEHHTEALRSVQALSGADSGETATQHIYLGDVWRKKKDYEKAAEYYNRGLNIDVKIEVRSLAAARDYARLADLYAEQNDFDKSALSYQSVIDIYNSIFGENHAIVASQWDVLGALWLESPQRVRQSLNIFQRTSNIWKKVLDSFDPRLAHSYGLLGQTYHLLSWEKQAKRMFSQALSIEEEASGECHSVVANRLSQLADVSQSIGRYDEALSTYRRLQSIYQKLYADSHKLHRELLTKIGQVEEVIAKLKKLGKSTNANPRDDPKDKEKEKEKEIRPSN